jgi:hypothetical protein
LPLRAFGYCFRAFGLFPASRIAELSKTMLYNNALCVYSVNVTDTLQKALQEVQKQIAMKAQVRDRLSAEIVQLQATEIGLRNALGQQVQAEIAWTELVLAVLNSYPGKFLSAVQIRDTLVSWGYNFAGINNPLAFINTCVQRLAEQGRVTRTPTGRPFRFSCE